MKLSAYQVTTSAMLLLAVVVLSQSWFGDSDEGRLHTRRALVASLTSDLPKMEHSSEEMLRTVEMKSHTQHYFRCGIRAGGRVDTDDNDVHYWIYEVSGQEVVNHNLGQSDALDGKMYASPAYHDDEDFVLPSRDTLTRFSPSTWYYYVSNRDATVSCSKGITVLEREEEEEIEEEEEEEIEEEGTVGGIPVEGEDENDDGDGFDNSVTGGGFGGDNSVTGGGFGGADEDGDGFDNSVTGGGFPG